MSRKLTSEPLMGGILIDRQTTPYLQALLDCITGISNMKRHFTSYNALSVSNICIGQRICAINSSLLVGTLNSLVGKGFQIITGCEGEDHSLIMKVDAHVRMLACS